MNKYIRVNGKLYKAIDSRKVTEFHIEIVKEVEKVPYLVNTTRNKYVAHITGKLDGKPFFFKADAYSNKLRPTLFIYAVKGVDTGDAYTICRKYHKVGQRQFEIA